ncbi:aldehyde ferredoxin oxidoreductase family protein [Geobacter hydrogenophilus]|uniref:Aldehyde ferredoxin oxidoreductase n=1 Tax=Geobacter hydrogenophilus TaxID=40983 RepID=A0A9W6G3Y1_9BACT|nr:aldehyde ferredoxin oxidoreductase family protein [Geobacter hydrogenophilus]MBT0892507.1 aldehyde ferredoxin oxidoreductase family protein [Geobacter hydrogenophilus]GLI39903.1 aldehyde ferredoxin oxidoreductase [Geobacter hydrogenophilus]
MKNGWNGKVLRVNLSTRTCAIEDLNMAWAREYLGGRGLGSKYLTEEVAPETDPLSPDNKLILVTGPLTGTYGAANGRYMAVTKSPLTGTIASSNSGGYFPNELKFAGFDLVIIEGKADRPVYLKIHNQRAEVADATHLWGKSTNETEDMILREFHADAKVACIGPAGEKLVRFACIVNDKHRAAGRSGVGAVMGSKYLKAVAVRGTGGVGVADAPAFREAARETFRMLRSHPVTAEGLPALGTAVLMNVINQSGALPTRNFQSGTFEGAEEISGERLAQTYLKRNKGCMGCVIGCGRVTALSDPRWSGNGEGPEYETLWALGAACGIADLAAITKANYLCNEYGMDTITAGSTVACAMELYQQGLVTEAETGIPLTFGSGEALVRMFELIGTGEGFGARLGLGSWGLAESYGVPELSMTVKKLEFPAYDGRGIQGMALEYATSNRGACHVRGYMVSPEILGVPEKLDPQVTEGKAGWTKAFQDFTAVVDSAGICLFTTFAIGAPQVTNLLNTATGLNLSQDQVLAAGERVWNLERVFNLKAGISPSQDTLPPRLLQEPLPDGPMKGEVAKLGAMLPDYYRVRGWDEGGVPTAEKLATLGLV